MGLGWKQWTRERLPAASLQGYLQDQVVAVFPSAAARAATIAAPTEGMHSYLADVKRREVYQNGAWVAPEALGVIAFGGATSAFSSGSAAARVTGAVNLSVDLWPGRLYAAEMFARGLTDTAGATVELMQRITRLVSTPAAADTAVSGATAYLAVVSGPGAFDLRPEDVFTVANADSYQVNPWARRAAGAGTISIAGSAHLRYWARVRDLGPVTGRSVTAPVAITL